MVQFLYFTIIFSYKYVKYALVTFQKGNSG